MTKQYRVIRQELYNGLDAYKFADELSASSEEGYTVESCGINSEGYGQAWAILSKPVEEPPKPINLVEAVKEIAWMCKSKDSCTGCPLSKRDLCLASCGRAGGVPAGWVAAKED